MEGGSGTVRGPASLSARAYPEEENFRTVKQSAVIWDLDGVILDNEILHTRLLPFLESGTLVRAPIETVASPVPTFAADPVLSSAGVSDMLVSRPEDPKALFASANPATAEKEPIEVEDGGLPVFPSFITFFCNPYCFETDALSTNISLDTLEEVHLGFMGKIDDVRIALFSSVSMFPPFREETPFKDREHYVQERMTHRFSFLLSVTPLPHFTVGAASGAHVVEKPRCYIFELILEARLHF